MNDENSLGSPPRTREGEPRIPKSIDQPRRWWTFASLDEVEEVEETTSDGVTRHVWRHRHQETVEFGGPTPSGAPGGSARRIFLGHTSELREFPRDRSFIDAAEAAVTRAGDAVIDMAYFTARDSRPADYCRQALCRADLYVGIIGLSYGSPVRDRQDVSYTEMEYEVATELGLQRLVFLLDEDAPLPLPARTSIDRTFGARQDAFRRRLRDGGLVALVESPAELETQLYQALVPPHSV
jgi:Domain of unknown function (DUF4062)